MSQIKKGAALNYVTILLTNVIGIVMTPFILSHLGKSEYGIYITVGALVAVGRTTIYPDRSKVLDVGRVGPCQGHVDDEVVRHSVL